MRKRIEVAVWSAAAAFMVGYPMWAYLGGVA